MKKKSLQRAFCKYVFFKYEKFDSLIVRYSQMLKMNIKKKVNYELPLFFHKHTAAYAPSSHLSSPTTTAQQQQKANPA